MRIRRIAAFVVAAAALTACDGLKEAFTAHVDVAARAGSQELSVTRLGDLLGGAKLQVPVSKENARVLADLWVSYQLLGVAAARGDSLTDTTIVMEAARSFVDNAKIQRLMDSVSKTWAVDTAGAEAAYNAAQGNLYAARHILIGREGMSPAEKDSAKRIADQVRSQVTNENFPQMVARFSNEPGAGERGGMLGVYPKNAMVPQFSDAVAALKPGEISPVFESQFGWHIAQRLPYAMIKDQFAQQHGRTALQRAESTYMAGLTSKAKLKIDGDAPAELKKAAADLDANRGEKDALASYEGGEVTVGEMVRAAASQGPAAGQQIIAAPDSLLRGFIEEVARREILVKEADRAKITMPAQDRDRLFAEWGNLVGQLWEQLGITPAQLADSAKTQGDRERVAAARVESYLDRMMSGQAQLVQVPAVMSGALRDRFEGRVTNAGIDRAVERAQKVRTAADSAKGGAQPGSAVPMPQPPGGQPGSAVPMPAPPAPAPGQHP